MVVKKVAEKLASCFGGGKDEYIATNDGTVESGYAYGATPEEAINNLKKQSREDSMESMTVVIRDEADEITTGTIDHDAQIGDVVTVTAKDENGNAVEARGTIIEIA